tara:strand:+ start:5340 stop:7109 length:1770 start_codon:yes stop_codon:yes gene_type:complete
MDKLNEYERMWGVSPEDPHKISDAKKLVELSYKVININEDTGVENIYEKFQSYIDEIINMKNELDEKGNFEINVRINRILEITYYAQNVCVGINRIAEVMDQSKDFRDNGDASLFRFKPINWDKNSKYQNFLLYVLGEFYKNKYARYNGDVYKVILNDEGYNTHAWERYGTISEVIYKLIKKETNFDQFINVTSAGNCVRSASEFLTNCTDSQFPQLKKDRHIFSFKNGIYFAKEDKFVEYKSEGFRKIKSTTVSAKYFSKKFNVEKKWEDIETPLFDSIFKHQKVDDDILRWVYVMTGRLIYEIDELDGWQVIFFVQGQAGTGKSTYANYVCKQLYEEEDVGIMSNNIQRTFGLSDLVDKKLYIAPEIKRDFNIEQGEFQSIVSGDKVTINIKFQNSRFENWVIPGVMAGNECPDFIDNAGSIQRRMVTLRFTKKVTKGDLNLGKKLKDEMPDILQKCNKAYIECAEEFGRDTIWSVLPKYFLESQEELAKATNPLMHFLLSEKITIESGKYIPERLFKQAFRDHCIENNYAKHRWNQDFYMGPFSQHNIAIVRNDARCYLGRVEPGPFIIGCDLKCIEMEIDKYSEL